MGCESCLENGLVFGRCCRLVPLPFTMGCMFQVSGLHVCGLLRRATVIHGNVGYALKVMAKLELSGLKGGYLKVWMPRRLLNIKSCSVSSLYFFLSKVFLLSQVKDIYNPLHELSSAVSLFSIAIPMRLSCQELNLLVTKCTFMCIHTIIHAQNIFVGHLQSSFLSLKISVHGTRFLYEKTRMKVGKNPVIWVLSSSEIMGWFCSRSSEASASPL